MAVAPPAPRGTLERSGAARLPDRVLSIGLVAVAVAVFALIVFFFGRLIYESREAFDRFGVVGFVFDKTWSVSRSSYGALPLLVGTLVTSAIALVIGVPIAVATALFVTEQCPRALRGPLVILVDLLAAVPSVVYGLWGFFVLESWLLGPEKWVDRNLAFLPFFGSGAAGPNYFVAGLILAIMILPIVSAISREVLASVPPDLKEAALALGLTRWEMLRTAVLPTAKTGITGAAMLGLGRAIGETVAVTLVIGNSARIGDGLFDQGYTLAAVIANEFGEAASNPLHRSALIAAGLVLFVLTLIVNAAARFVVTRGRVDRAAGGETVSAAT